MCKKMDGAIMAKFFVNVARLTLCKNNRSMMALHFNWVNEYRIVDIFAMMA